MVDQDEDEETVASYGILLKHQGLSAMIKMKTKLLLNVEYLKQIAAAHSHIANLQAQLAARPVAAWWCRRPACAAEMGQ